MTYNFNNLSLWHDNNGRVLIVIGRRLDTIGPDAEINIDLLIPSESRVISWPIKKLNRLVESGLMTYRGVCHREEPKEKTNKPK